MIKRISELTNEELKEVFAANSKLQENVLDDMIESEMYWVSEELDYLKPSLNDWSIGACQHNYIKVGDSSEFIDNLLALQEDYGFFSDSKKHIITDTEALRDKFFNMEGPSEDDFEDEEGELDEEAFDRAVEDYEALEVEVEDRYEEAVKELAEAVAHKYTERFDYFYTSEAQESYFLEFYAQERMDDTYYIDTEADEPFELVEEVSYKKSYK